MKKWLGWLGLAATGVVGLVLVCAACVYGLSEARLRKNWEVKAATLAIPADSVSIARGDHLVHSLGGCAECHGEKLQGKKMIDEPVFARVSSINLTRGKGGVGALLTDADFVRALRNGVGPNGRALVIMPSRDYGNLSDADVAAIIAYLHTIPSVDNETSAPRLGPVARAMLVAGKLPFFDAEVIDHERPHVASVTPSVTAGYGAYLASVGCKGCHGPALAGGPIPGGPPDSPPAANLTPGGSLKNWTEQDFVNTIRTGVRPNKIPLNEAMPWKVFRNLTDDELAAVWMYLKTLPGTPTPGLQTASR